MSLLRVAIGDQVPVGSYWQDITASALPAWQQWLGEHKGAVVVTATEERDSLTWYAFRVVSPVVWRGPGYPSIIPAGASVTSSSDVMQVPSVADPVESLMSAALGAVKWGGGALLALLGARLLLGKKH